MSFALRRDVTEKSAKKMTESCRNQGRPEVEFVAFALGDCIVDVEQNSAKYLRPVHRTALELAIHNHFGTEIGGFWLMAEQIDQLRRLADCYPANESPFVTRAIEAYLRAQLPELYSIC
jgi:hypothetical protein